MMNFQESRPLSLSRGGRDAVSPRWDHAKWRVWQGRVCLCAVDVRYLINGRGV